MLKVFFGILILSLSLNIFGSSKKEVNQVTKIGIISALDFESSYLKSKITDVKIDDCFNRKFYNGKINGMDVVVSTVGIGIVNASVGTAIMIEKYKPSLIILTGVGGGTSATVPGDTVICSGTTYYDFGILDDNDKFIRLSAFTPQAEFTSQGDEPLNFTPDKFLFDAAQNATKISKLSNLLYKGKEYKAKAITGIISTTETFANLKSLKKEREITNCVITDMEAAGAAQVCYQQKVPFLVIKSVSDDGDLNMYYSLKNISAKNSEIIVLNTIKILKALQSKQLTSEK